MKKLLLLFVVFFASASMKVGLATAQETLVGTEFTVNLDGVNVIFTITSDSDTKTVKVGCQNGDYNHTAVAHNISQTIITIPETVSYEGTDYTVTAIGEGAFWVINKLQQVIMPATIESIGGSAFYGDYSLTSIEIPAAVTSIGYMAFYDCYNIQSVTVSGDNSKFDSRGNCNAIIETQTNKLVYGFKCSTIPSTVTKIGSLAFSSIDKLEITIPSTVTTIESGAFAWCHGAVFTVDRHTPLEIDEGTFSDVTDNYCVLRVPKGTREAYLAASGWNKFKPEYVLEEDEVLEFTENITTEGETVCMTFSIYDRNANTVKVGPFYEYYGGGSKIIKAVSQDITATAIAIPETITHDGVEYTVTVIGDYAFSSCRSIERLTLPNTITSIGEYAFQSCSISSFEIPASVTSIGEGILCHCILTSLTVAEGNEVFESPDGCNAIIEKTAHKLIIGTNATRIIPESVIEIGEKAFWNIWDMNIKIPTSVCKIGSQAFGACQNSIFIVNYSADELSDIDVAEDAFNYGSYNTLRVPTGTKDYYLAATGWNFFSSENIVEVQEFTASVATGDGTTVDLIFTITSDGDNKTVKVGHLVGSNTETAFGKDIRATSIIIPETITYEGKEYTVTAIGDYAFRRAGILNISLPPTITSIGANAFDGCQNLTSFEIPSGVTSIGDAAFSDCVSLTSVNSKIEAPFDISNNVFSDYSTPTLTVPNRAKKAYEVANGWKKFVTIVEVGLEPMDGQQEIDYGEDGNVDENTNLEGTIIDNVYYNISADNGGFDAEDKCIVVNKAMSDVEIETVFGKDLQSEEVIEAFAGLVIQVPAGKGNVEINAQTTGGIALKVKVGSADPVTLEFNGKLKVNVPYNVIEPTYVYIYAGETATSSRRMTRGNSQEGSLRIYGLGIESDTFKSGDADGDNLVDVADVVVIVNYILEKHPEKFVLAAADVIKDKTIDVADVVGTVNIILERDVPSSSRAIAENKNDYNDQLLLTCSDDMSMSLCLNSQSQYVAAQFDVKLTDGQSIERLTLNSSRAYDYQLRYEKISPNLYRVMIYSLDVSDFMGYEGELVNIRLNNGEGNMRIENIKFITSDYTIKEFAPLYNNTTGIKEMVNFPAADIYSVDGRLVRKQATTTEGVKKGIYIVNNQKIVVK